MDFIDAYSYGYDQVNVNPVRHMEYDDSEFMMFKTSQRDPMTNAMHAHERYKEAYRNSLSNPSPYSNRGIDQYNERKRIEENIEDILRPYSRNMYKVDNVKDRIKVKGNDVPELEYLLNEMEKKEHLCKECRMTKKCDSCQLHSEHENNKWFSSTNDTNLFLILLVVILTAFCVIQYVNTQTINATLLGMIKNQDKPPAWLKMTENQTNSPKKPEEEE